MGLCFRQKIGFKLNLTDGIKFLRIIFIWQSLGFRQKSGFKTKPPRRNIPQGVNLFV